MKTNKSTILIIALLALVSLMIAPVMAETLTGTLGGSSFAQSLYDTGIGSSSPIVISQLNVNSIEYSKFTTALIREEYRKSNFAGTTPSGNTSPFNGTIGSQIVCTGTIGYQRFFDNLGNEQPGYTWMTFNGPWNVTGLTGDQHIVITYNNIDGWTNTDVGFVDVPAGDGDIYFSWSANRYAAGKYTRTMQETIYNSYSFTKPSGIGITGLVTKTVGGTSYASKIFIMNATSDAIITSDYTINPVDLPLATTAQSIRVAMFSPGGIWYNSSILFAAAVPTVTPTPMPTIPPGYVRSYVEVRDTSGDVINGATINIEDIETGNWANSTNDVDGFHYIDTLPYHNLNIYGLYALVANVYLPNEILNKSTGFVGASTFLTLYPYTSPAPAGSTSLYVEVRDSNTYYFITGATVMTKASGITQVKTTGTGGTAVFQITNNTDVSISASASGYKSATGSTNTGAGAEKTYVITLTRQIVTPTPTYITPVVTVDIRDDTKKATDAFSKWMSVLGDITDIAIGVVIIWLMWLTVYMITGGKIIDKIMRRGRGRR